MNDQEFTVRARSMERKLYRIAHAILWNDADCADAIQEAVFKGWMKKGSLRQAQYFETWLVRILINACRNLIRKQKSAPLPASHRPCRLLCSFSPFSPAQACTSM